MWDKTKIDNIVDIRKASRNLCLAHWFILALTNENYYFGLRRDSFPKRGSPRWPDGKEKERGKSQHGDVGNGPYHSFFKHLMFESLSV